MKKMLFVGFSPVMGGIETFMINMIEKFKERTDIIIDLLVFSPNYAGKSKVDNFINQTHLVQTRKQDPFNYKKEIYNILKSESYDIVWSNQVSLSDITLVQTAIELNAETIVLYSHSSKNPDSLLTNILHNKNKRKLNKYSGRFHAWACSEDARKHFYNSSNISNQKVFLNAIDLDSFYFNEAKRKSIRSELQIENNFVIASVGRLQKVKNHSFIIENFNKILKIIPEAIYIIVGEGELTDEYQDLINTLDLSKNIKFLGFRNDVNQLLNAFDYLVMPSLYEGLPYALVEAQVNGLPSLASSNITNDVKFTNLVKFEPISEFSIWLDVLESFINDKELQKNRGKIISEEIINSPFNLNSQIDTFIEILDI